MSIIKIYKTKLTPERNALVDNLSEYLSSLTAQYENDSFQYIQLGLDIRVKLDLPQNYVGNEIGNYLDLYQDNKHFYFFIMGANWKAKNTVELELSIDSINTFRDDFTFTNKTEVIREHKDRIKKVPIYFEVESSEYERLGSFTNYINIYDQYMVGKSLSDIKEISLEYSEDSDWEVLITGRTFNSEQGRLTIITTPVPSNKTVKVKGHAKVIDYYNNMRNIDFKSEGVPCTLYHNESEDVDLIQEDNDRDWYLGYRNISAYNSTNPDDFTVNNTIECILCSDEDVTLKGITNTDSFNVLTLENDTYYVLFYDDQPDGILAYSTENPPVDGQPDTRTFVTKSFKEDKYNYNNYAFYKQGTQIWLIRGKCEYDSNLKYFSQLSWTTKKIKEIKLYGCSKIYKCDNTFTVDKTVGYIKSHSTVQTVSEEGESTVAALSTFNRLDTKNIKLLKLPYCPAEVKNETLIGGNWRLSTDNFLRLNDLNTKFNYTWNPKGVNIYNIFKLRTFTPSLFTTRDDYYESKIYHSDYYQPKMVYDAFGFNFLLETINDVTYGMPFDIEYIVSTTINSRFMFKFPQYSCKYATNDYNNILTVARNNEMTLYNSAYVNYIRDGYNYDVNSKNRKIGADWLSFGTNVGTTVFNIAGAAGGGGSLKSGINYSNAISGASNLVTGLYSAITNTVDAEEAMKTKLNELNNQAVTLTGSEDIDLVSNYTHNRAKMCYYKSSDDMKRVMCDLWFYTGYNVQEKKLPNTTSRVWFNYIQCNPVFNESNTNVYKLYTDDIKARYASGVTVYHMNTTTAGVNTWDWNQEYENFETILF